MGHKVPLTMDTDVTVPRLHSTHGTVCWSVLESLVKMPSLCNRIYDYPR